MIFTTMQAGYAKNIKNGMKGSNDSKSLGFIAIGMFFDPARSLARPAFRDDLDAFRLPP